MPTILMTFDLEEADAEDYEEGYRALVQKGLQRVSPNKKLRLPYSSVMGDTDVGANASEIRDALKAVLEDSTGKRVGRMLVTVAEDWACYGEGDKKQWFRELVQRVMGTSDVDE